jgi:hypothetical protein
MMRFYRADKPAGQTAVGRRGGGSAAATNPPEHRFRTKDAMRPCHCAPKATKWMSGCTLLRPFPQPPYVSRQLLSLFPTYIMPQNQNLLNAPISEFVKKLTVKSF